MRVLVGCERSGIVRNAFRKRGHQAYSCDLAPAEDNQRYHLQGDLRDFLNDDWDLAVFHPPCTHLSCIGARWFDDPRFPDKRRQMAEAVRFVRLLYDCPIPRVCIENPKGVLSTQWRKPDQIIDPMTFGHGSTKETHLWLKNLPPLTVPDMLSVPVLESPDQELVARGKWLSHGFYKTGSEDKAVFRSRTFVNIAYAMASQWG